MPDARAEAVSAMTVRQVIVRACTRCGGPRNLESACDGCGLTQPPETTDLGVTSATYRNPIKAALWNLIGSRLAQQRIHRANQRTKQREKEVRSWPRSLRSQQKDAS